MNTPALSRRTMLQVTAAGVLAAITSPTRAADGPATRPAGDPLRGLKFGIATYSFRNLSLDDCIKGIARLGVKYCSIKDAHLPLRSSPEERKAVVEKFKAAGITPLSAGVINLPNNDPAAARLAFEYGRDCSLPVLVLNPAAALLPTVEKLVQEFNIKVAIHNHGPGDAWPAPASIHDAIKTMDPRMGLCMDVGHTARAGVDPGSAIQLFKDRLFDVHLKDLTALDKGTAGECELGRGILDIPSILQALLAIRYQYHLGLEHERNASDPIPGAAESVGYTRGVLQMLK
jgi:sugar phosphate isomerase/epimerase